jgi:hypothetical protein
MMEKNEMTRMEMLSLCAPMNLKFFQRLMCALSICTLVLTFAGCASKEERAAQQRWETEDERAARHVFRSGWIRPSVTEEDKDFYYRSFLR